MRVADKIEKYAAKLMKEYKGEVVESEKSRYFNIKGRILRISDHIGSNSSGNISIIIPDFSDKNEYIVHAHSSGSISIASYEQVKDIVRSFVYMSSFMTEILQPSFVFEIERRDKFDASKVCKNYEDEIARLKKIEGKYNILKKVGNIESNDDTVLGVPSSAFTEGQLKAIKATVDSVLRNLKK